MSGKQCQVACEADCVCARCGECRAGQGVTHECRKPMTKGQAIAFLEALLVEGLAGAVPDLERGVRECAPGTVEAEDCKTILGIAQAMIEGMRRDMAALQKAPGKVVQLGDEEALRLVRTLRETH